MTPLLVCSWFVASLALQATPEVEAFDALLIRYAGAWPGAALVAREGQPVIAKGYGFADFEANRPNDADSLFDAGPITQAFTALAVARLAQDGRLTLDDALAVHVSGVPAHSQAITLRQLLGHTSGIAGRNDGGRGEDATQAMLHSLGRGPSATPGARRETWNPGYALLAAAVEHASGRTFTTHVEEELLRPAGMLASGFSGDARLAARSALGQGASGAVRYAFESPSGSYGYQERGVVGLVTSVRDLLAFDRALTAHSLVDEDHVRELFTPVFDGHALGWDVSRAADGSPRLSCGGSTPGFAAEFRRLPGHDACVAVLSCDERAPVHEICENLERLLLGRPLASPAPKQGLPEVEGAASAGTYVSAEGRLVLRAAPGVLMAGIEGHELLGRVGANETLSWKPDLAALEKHAFECVDGLARGDTRSLRTHMAPRLPRTWPDTLRQQAWPAHLALHGAYRGARPLGPRTRGGKVEVLLALDHERGPARVLATFGPAGLEALDWQGPEFPATARLEPIRKGTFRLLVGADPPELECVIEGSRATSVRLAGLVLARSDDPAQTTR